MSLRLNGSTSGYSEIDAPAIAGNNTLVLPTTNGVANQLLKNGSTPGVLEYSLTTLDSSGNLGSIASINGGPLAGFRNRIINGGMLIDQRNGGASQVITTTGAYTVDRWICVPIGASVTGQRVTRTTDNQFGYQITGAAGVTTTAFLQRIEAASCASLANTTVTLSALLSNTVLTTVNWQLFYPSATDNFATNTSIASGSWTVTSTDAIYTAQISIPAAATTGLQLNLSVGAQTSGTWIVSRVQLEPGPVATPFEQRPIGTELALCQRYYQAQYVHMQAPAAAGMIVPVYFSVPMRATPTATNLSLGTESNVISVTINPRNYLSAYFQFTASVANAFVLDRVDAYSAEL